MEQDIKTFFPMFTVSGTVSENGVAVFDVVKRATAILQPVMGQEGLMLPVIKPREDTTENRDCLMIKFEEGDAAFSRCNTNTFEYAEVLGNNKLFVPKKVNFDKVGRQKAIIVFRINMPHRSRFSLKPKWGLKFEGNSEDLSFPAKRTLLFSDTGHQIVVLGDVEGKGLFFRVVWTRKAIYNKKAYNYDSRWFKLDGYNIVGPLTREERDYYVNK